MKCAESCTGPEPQQCVRPLNPLPPFQGYRVLTSGQSHQLALQLPSTCAFPQKCPASPVSAPQGDDMLCHAPSEEGHPSSKQKDSLGQKTMTLALSRCPEAQTLWLAGWGQDPPLSLRSCSPFYLCCP